MIRFWTFFLRHRQFTYLLIVGLTILGILSVIAIPKESAPEVRIPMGIISVVYPGASATTVENLITNKIEDGLLNLSDLKNLTSTSDEGIAVVIAEFSTDAELDKSLQKLKDEMDKIKVDLPEEAKEPVISEINFADQPIMVITVSSDRPAKELVNLADKLKQELKKVDGVAKVELSGVRQLEVQVVVDKNRLQDSGLSLVEVVGALSSANITAPVGEITTNNINYTIKLNSDLTTPADLNYLPLIGRAGEVIYLRDIALISDGVAKASNLSRVSQAGQASQQAIACSIYKKAGGDITRIGSAVKSKVTRLEQDLLRDTEVLISFDNSKMVRDDLLGLLKNGLMTVLLVATLLFITLGWREALVASLTIPLSFLIAFIGLNYSGNTINFISLFSLILAIGILVDSGIVVTESIHRRMTLGQTGYTAASKTIEEYGWPLIAGTLTTVAVFVPLFFIEGITGKFIASIPFTIIFVLLASIFVALALAPLIAIRLLSRENLGYWSQVRESYTVLAEDWYRQKLANFLRQRSRHRKLFLSLLLAFILVVALPIVGLVKTTFFPQSDIDYVFLELERPVGTPLAQTDLSVRMLEEILYDVPEAESFITTVGAGSSFGGAGGSGERLANITVNLRSDRKRSSSDITEFLRQEITKIKDARVRVIQPNNGPPIGAPVEIKFIGDDYPTLLTTAKQAEDLLNTITGAKEVSNSANDSATEIAVAINRALAAQYGLTPLQITQTLRTAVYGSVATVIKQSDRDIDVRVKLGLNQNFVDVFDTTQVNLDAIRQLPIKTPAGQTVLLGSVADFRLVAGTNQYKHEGGKRLITVSAYNDSQTTVSDIIAEFKNQSTKLAWPAGVEMKFGGETEEVNQSFVDMFFALLVGILLMLAILILEFNSWRYAIYVLMILPLSLVGVLLGLALMRQPLSFPSLLGFIALSGIVVNNSIILIDSINLSRRQQPTADLLDTVVESSVSRLRPIFLTTSTTVIGMVPLLFSSEIWGPLAAAVMFGLSFAVILTLLIVPLVYYRWPGKLE